MPDHSSSDDSTDSDNDYQPPPQPIPETVTLTLPRKDLLRGTAKLSTRCKISHRVATAVMANFVKMGGGDLNTCSISTSTSHRHRAQALAEAKSHIMKEFTGSIPKHLVLHWDGKVIKYAPGF